MKDKTFFLNTALAVIMGILLLAAVLVQVFAPIVMEASVDIPDLVLICLAALLADHYLAAGAKRCYVWNLLLAVVTFGILPWAAGVVAIGAAWKLALVGGVVFTAVTWLFTSMQERMHSGPGSKVTPIVCAFGLYLAAQCFAGMIL